MASEDNKNLLQMQTSSRLTNYIHYARYGVYAIAE